jgi:hypothetical protein
MKYVTVVGCGSLACAIATPANTRLAREDKKTLRMVGLSKKGG